MTMEITNSYVSGYINSTKQTGTTKEENVTRSTVELKISKPGVTKTE